MVAVAVSAVFGTMSGFTSEERAAPFTLEYRVFLSEFCGPPRPPARRPFILGPVAPRGCGPWSRSGPGSSARPWALLAAPARETLPFPVSLRTRTRAGLVLQVSVSGGSAGKGNH